ncbi:uncharacterized protein LOC128997917 [Macrosteles quadrilineatus]|uniref:uncharacterized protein LOC128997917 n=1 Tax=Macrosteles quadrilineatus TaxID=74068 RepID=UPI0023E2E253|nr:uncharacterized protein LOC128997917 [Macrosteles quadrilineatus]XP_054279723.1 uncharacterized protein LOC128997917 [Macrosteles quadrilineatus]
MQDMSGYVLSDTTLPQSDEQLGLTISTAQTENDFFVQDPGLPSPEFILGDTEGVIIEDSDMFDNSNLETLQPKSIECEFESPFRRNLSNYSQTNHTRTISNMGEEERNSLPSKLSSFHPRVKFPNVNNIKPKYLQIIDSELPLINEDPDMYCTENKMNFDINANVNVSEIVKQEPSIDQDETFCSADFKDMGVAQEVVVRTEEEDKHETSFNVFPMESVPSDSENDLSITEEIPKKEADDGIYFKLDPLSLDSVIGDLFNNLGTTDDDMYKEIGYDYGIPPTITPEEIKEDYIAANSMSLLKNLYINKRVSPIITPDNTSHAHAHLTASKTSAKPMAKPPLTLDIGAARAALLDDKGISDTPELLEALKPEVGKFDLIKFITTNGDPNNNAPSPTVETQPNLGAPRKGKSHLSLTDLKHAQDPARGRALSRTGNGDEEEDITSLPSTSAGSPAKRPARQSATRFNKMIEEGFLSSVVDSPPASSDEEDDEPKHKRRRTTSTTSSRRRLNSDSDQSSVSEDAMKYRERRDRNNLSSKRSRMKRKMHLVSKQKELKILEEKNARLREKVEQLESVLSRVQVVWTDHLSGIKDSDKDRGDEH